MKAKTVYTPPISEMVEVEFESGFMESSVPEENREISAKDSPVDAGDQVIEGNYVFDENDWDIK